MALIPSLEKFSYSDTLENPGLFTLKQHRQTLIDRGIANSSMAGRIFNYLFTLRDVGITGEATIYHPSLIVLEKLVMSCSRCGVKHPQCC